MRRGPGFELQNFFFSWLNCFGHFSHVQRAQHNEYLPLETECVHHCPHFKRYCIYYSQWLRSFRPAFRCGRLNRHKHMWFWTRLDNTSYEPLLLWSITWPSVCRASHEKQPSLASSPLLHSHTMCSTTTSAQPASHLGFIEKPISIVWLFPLPVQSHHYALVDSWWIPPPPTCPSSCSIRSLLQTAASRGLFL